MILNELEKAEKIVGLLDFAKTADELELTEVIEQLARDVGNEQNGELRGLMQTTTSLMRSYAVRPPSERTNPIFQDIARQIRQGAKPFLEV